MEVKAGYKQTEIGIIPEDWGIKPLSELTKDIGDGIHATPEYVSTSDYYFINGNNLLDGEIIITENTMCVSDKEYRRLRKQLDSSTVLMSINGTIGNLAYFHDEKVVLGKSAAYMNVKQELRKEFLYYMLQSHATKTYYEDELTGTTIRNLSLGSIRNTPIPIPPTLAEQEAIAEALSDADALIEALEQLIAKKRQIKQGAMEDLLSGKRRLPKFVKKNGYKPTEIGLIPEDWEVVSVGDISVVGRGRVISHKEIDKSLTSMYPVYSSQTSDNGVMGYIDTFDFEGEYITWTTDGAKAGTVFYRNGKFNCTNVCGTIKLKKDDHYFIARALSRFAYKHVSRHLGNPKIMNDVMKKVKIPIPLSVEEQTAIAEILSDMDTEIAALEGKLSKAREVKAGMMSVLLTGRVRLV